MAALDILQTPTPVVRTSGPQNITITFGAVATGDLLLFALNVRTGTAVVTPPSGLTLLTNKSGWPRLLTYARVVQSGDSTSWQWSTDIDTALVLQAWRIEGAFANLSGVTGGEDAEFLSETSRRTLASDVSVGANTLVYAMLGKYSTSAVTFSNSFATAVSTDEGVTQLSSARRLYTSAATDVSTTPSWTGATSGAAALIRIAAPSGGGPDAATLLAYRKNILRMVD